uniref:Uncharacterized protein n=1 Tax=Chaetoceros debilis TaxID=122233 RepID=A0A7S3V9Q2_9STRA
MTPLHILSMNPHAPTDGISSLLKASITAANVRDNRGKTALYYALHYNPCAFVRMYAYLLEHSIEIDIYSWFVYLNDHYEEEKDHGCTPLHVLAQNPFVPADAITRLMELKMDAVFFLDSEGMSPLDYARECNVEGLVLMIAILCNHRNAMDGFDDRE